LAFLTRWSGRLLGLAALAFVAWFLIAHIVAGKGPNPFQFSAVEAALTATLFATVIGMLIGWRWELAGGLLITFSMAIFLVIEGLASHSWPRGWVIWLLPVPGILYLLAFSFSARHARQLMVTK
jgi:hypothetical protein